MINFFPLKRLFYKFRIFKKQHFNILHLGLVKFFKNVSISQKMYKGQSEYGVCKLNVSAVFELFLKQFGVPVHFLGL